MEIDDAPDFANEMQNGDDANRFGAVAIARRRRAWFSFDIGDSSVSQLLKIGSQPISLLVGPKIYVEGPRSAPDWGMRFAFILLFPR